MKQPHCEIILKKTPGKKIYFASDQHLGSGDKKTDRQRELLFLSWLKEIEKDAEALFLMGDLFDFWHEWNTVVPKGFVRILGQLAHMADSGIKLYFFVGNHDLWMKDYFQEELGIPVFHDKIFADLYGKKFLLAHGDGLGPEDYGYKRMKKVFTNPVCKWAFSWIHPDLSMKLAQYMSRKNKLISGEEDVKFLGPEKEFLIRYAERKSVEYAVEYFVFGHRHLPMTYKLNSRAVYVNLGDWISYHSYAVLDSDFSLKYYKLRGNE